MNEDIIKYWKDKSKETGMGIQELKNACNQSLLIWAETHRKIMGKPFSLEDYPYMEDIYLDMSKNICIIKSAQSSLSEYFVNIMFWVADSNKGHSYMAFPTKTDMGIFVQGRINTASEETPYLKHRLKGNTDNTSIKRFGLRNMYFTGAQKRTQIISSPADIVCQDEYDEHNDVENTILKRMNNSKLKLMRKASTPTVPGYGISREYMKSSMAVWVHKCKHCKKETNVSGLDIADRWKDLIKEIGDEEYIYCCPHCKEEADFTIGKWRHQNPEKKYHGYSINRLMTRTCSANELMDAYRKASDDDMMSEFYNSDLGIPYEIEGNRIYERDIDACKRDYNVIKAGSPGRQYFIGIDTGKLLHVVIGRKDLSGVISIEFAGVVKDFEDLHQFFDLFNICFGVADNRPEPTPVFSLFKKYKIFRGAEHNSGSVSAYSNNNVNEHIIGWNRFFSIERVYNYILKQKIELPKNIDSHTDKWFTKHLISQMKVKKISEKGSVNHDYIPITGKKKTADHYLFALIFMLASIDAYESLKDASRDSGFMLT